VVSGRWVFETDPVRAVALIDRDPTFRTDRTASAIIDFGGGRQVTFTVSSQSVPYQRIQIAGTRGRIEIQIPFNAPQGEATKIFIDDGSKLDGSSVQTETLPACDQYTLEGEAFTRAIRGEIGLPYGIDDAIVNARTIDALFRSEKSAKFEPV